MYFCYGVFQSTGYLSDEQKIRREANISRIHRQNFDPKNETINSFEENEALLT
jgi:ribonuclease HII